MSFFPVVKLYTEHTSMSEKITLSLDVPMDQLTTIVTKTVNKQLEYGGQYGYCGEAAQLIENLSKVALLQIIRNLDYAQAIKSLFEECFEKVARDVVIQEIQKLVKKTVKEMKDRGDLLNGSNN